MSNPSFISLCPKCEGTGAESFISSLYKETVILDLEVTKYQDRDRGEERQKSGLFGITVPVPRVVTRHGDAD